MFFNFLSNKNINICNILQPQQKVKKKKKRRNYLNTTKFSQYIHGTTIKTILIFEEIKKNSCIL